MYEKIVTLKDDEVVNIVNKNTGEERLLDGQGNPDFRVINQKFNKQSSAAWRLLHRQTTAAEFKVAGYMATLVNGPSNIIRPLCDELSYRQIGEILGVSHNRVKKMLDKLFKLGVYGRFEYYDEHEEHKKFWVFNPYLTRNGKGVLKETDSIFRGSQFALISR